MQIIWNGTGAAWSSHFGNASAVVEADGLRLLMDCGHTVPSRLKPMNLSLADMDACFISHLHGDHIYGLEEYGFRSRLIWNRRPRLFVPEHLALPLWRNVLSGTMAPTCDSACLLRDYFDVTTLYPGKPVAFGSWTLEVHPVEHVPKTPAYGLKIKADDVAVAFTCDTIAHVADWFYEDTEVVFHDCSFKPLFPDTVHTHFEELQAYSEERRRKTFLVHYDDEIAAKLDDPTFCHELAAAQLRLTEPYCPYKFGVS